MLCRALDAAGLRDYRIGLGERVAVPEADGRAPACPRTARAGAARARSSRATSSASSAACGELGLGDEAELLVRVPQLRGGAEVLERGGAGGRVLRGCTSCSTERRRASGVIFDLGLVRQLGYYTGAVFEVYDPALGAPIGARRALRRPARALRPRRCPPSASRWRRPAAHRADRRGARRDEPRSAACASPSRAARCSRETLDVLDRLGVDTAEVRANDRKLLFEDVGHRDDAPERRADLRRGRRRRHRHHRQGRADGAGRARGLRAARPRLRRVPDGARDRSTGPTRPRRRCAASASCASRRSTRRSPRDYFERTGRQAEIVEVKGSVELAPLTGLVEAIVDLTATGTTLRENGLVDARGDRRRDRAADRQPGRRTSSRPRRSTTLLERLRAG